VAGRAFFRVGVFDFSYTKMREKGAVGGAEGRGWGSFIGVKEKKKDLTHKDCNTDVKHTVTYTV